MERNISFEGFLSGCLMICTFHSLSFIGSFWFFEKHLYRDYEVKRLHIQYLFATTFTVCVSTLQLLLLELLHVLNPTLRRLVWHIDIVVVLALLYLALPIALVYTILDPGIDLISIPGHERTLLALPSSFTQKRRKLIFCVGCCVLLPSLWYVFYKFGSILQIKEQSYTFKNISERMLAYMGVCGVTVVAALAGFGSINYPYRNITTFLTPVTQDQMAEVERRLIQTLNLIAEKKKKWKLLHRNLHPRGGTNPSSNIEMFHYKRQQYWPAPSDSLYIHHRVLAPCSIGMKGEYCSDTENFNAWDKLMSTCKSPKGKNTLIRESKRTRETGSSCRSHSSSCKYSNLESGSRVDIMIDSLFKRASVNNIELNEERSGLERPTESFFMRSLGWLRKLAGISSYLWYSISGKLVDKECEVLQTEIKALEHLSRELFIGLDELVQSRSRVLFSQTYLGRLHNVTGWFMTGVCLYRVIMAIFNVIMNRRVSDIDPATKTLDIIFELLRVPIDVSFWAPYFSLLLMGWIIALNIRGFIEKLLTVFRYLSTSVSSNIFALLMSEVMGLYFSACAILMRTYLPEKYREQVTEVFGSSLDFSAFHLHFDLIFVVSCISSFILIMLSHKHKFDKFKCG